MRFFFVVCISLCVLVSCGRMQNTRSDVSSRIAVVLGPANTTWYIRLRQIVDQATIRHPNINWTVRNARDTDEQIGMLTAFKYEQFDAIIIMPLESFRLVPIAEDIYYSGTPTIILSRRLASPNYTALITGDNFGGGVNAARLLGERLDGAGNIVVLRSTIGSPVDAGRFNGFFETLQLEFPDMRIVGQGDAGVTRATGLSVMNSLLAEHSNITAVYAQDDEAALGALAAINNSGRTDIRYITGFGGTRAVFDFLMDDTSIFLASMSYFPSMGADAVEMAVSIVMGMEVPKETIISSQIIGDWNLRGYWDIAY